MYKIGWCSLARIKTHKTRDKPCSVQNGEAIVLHLDSSRPPRSLLWPPGVDTVLKPPKATSMFAYLPSLYSCSEQLRFQKQRYTSIERAIPCSHKGMGKKKTSVENTWLDQTKKRKGCKTMAAQLNQWGAQHCLAKPRGPTTKAYPACSKVPMLK